MKEKEDGIKARTETAFQILKGKKDFDNNLFLLSDEAAKTEFEAVLAINPNYYRALVGFGICNSFNLEYDKAIAVLKQAIHIEPNNAEAYYELGRVLLNAGEKGKNYFQTKLNIDLYNESLNYFQKALELNYLPKAELFNCMGTLLFRLESYQESITYFNQSAEYLIKEGGWQPSSFYLMAQANEILGNIKEAIRWYEMCKTNTFNSDQTLLDKKILQLQSRAQNK